jgi:hypothetical protein
MVAAPLGGDHRSMNPQPSSRNEARTPFPADLRWLVAATGASRRFCRTPPPWWQKALLAMRSPVVLLVIAGLVALGLLTVFQQVVAQSVSQSVATRLAMRTDTTWSCKRQTDIAARQRCGLPGGERPPSAVAVARAPR